MASRNVTGACDSDSWGESEGVEDHVVGRDQQARDRARGGPGACVLARPWRRSRAKHVGGIPRGELIEGARDEVRIARQGKKHIALPEVVHREGVDGLAESEEHAALDPLVRGKVDAAEVRQRECGRANVGGRVGELAVDRVQLVAREGEVADAGGLAEVAAAEFQEGVEDRTPEIADGAGLAVGEEGGEGFRVEPVEADPDAEGSGLDGVLTEAGGGFRGDGGVEGGEFAGEVERVGHVSGNLCLEILSVQS